VLGPATFDSRCTRTRPTINGWYTNDHAISRPAEAKLTPTGTDGIVAKENALAAILGHALSRATPPTLLTKPFAAAPSPGFPLDNVRNFRKCFARETSVAALSPDTKSDVDAIVETIIYLYTESRRLTKGMAAQFGLTGPQLTVIKLLEELGDLSLSSLSERIRAQNSTVTGIIDRMEREGLVRRERSTTDRRMVFIRLTDKGRELAQGIAVEPLEIFRNALASLPERDVGELLRILMKLQKSVLSRVEGAVAQAENERGKVEEP
jgi:DNA-binding MarR family transcriptional regulator